MRIVELTARIEQTGGIFRIIEPGIIGVFDGGYVDFGRGIGRIDVREEWIKDVASNVDELIDYLEQRKVDKKRE